MGEEDFNSINNLTKKDISKKSIFLSFLIFLYIFSLLFSYFFISLHLHKQFYTILQEIFLPSLLVSISTGFSIYHGKKWLNSNTPNKAIIKMPLAGLVSSFILDAVLWVFLFLLAMLNLYHADGAKIFMLSLIYIPTVIFISFLLGLYLLIYKKSERKKLFKIITTIALLVPYLYVIIEWIT